MKRFTKKSALGSLTAFFISCAFPCVWAAQDENLDKSKTRIQKIEERDERKFSPGAQVRDPHWRPDGGSTHSSEESCRPDLVASVLELKRTGSGVFARVKAGNFKDCPTTRNSDICFEPSGERGVCIGFVGRGWHGPDTSGWSQWVGMPGDADGSPFTVTATVDPTNREHETNEQNNTCTATLSPGEEGKVRICYDRIMQYYNHK